MKSIVAVAGSQGLDLVKSHLLAAPLAEALIVKHFGNSREEADKELERLGVVNGLDGINFKLSTLFAKGSDNDVVITACCKLKVMSLFKGIELETSICKNTRARAWLGGDDVQYKVVASETTPDPAGAAPPAATAEPATSAEPGTSEEPATSAEPGTSEEPATSEEPQTSEAPPETSEAPEDEEGDDGFKKPPKKPETTEEPEETKGPLSEEKVDWYLNVSQNNKNSDTAILGVTGSYDEIGKKEGYSYFKMHDAYWKDLEREAGYNYDEVWRVNEKYLDEQIKAGKKILLANDPNAGYYFDDGSKRFYQREIEYLKAKGYTFVKVGDVWEAVPPGGAAPVASASPSPSAAPTETATPAPTATPKPTATPTPSPTPTPNPTPTPSPTPTPTPKPSPTPLLLLPGPTSTPLALPGPVDTPTPAPSSPSPAPEESGSDVINKLDDVLSSKTLTNQTKKVDNYVSSIKGNAAAKADFDAMNPTNIRTYANGTIAGDLPDGRTINIHPSTTLGGTPSVEIYDPVTGKSIKIRY